MADALRLSPFCCILDGSARICVPASADGRAFLLVWADEESRGMFPFQPSRVFLLGKEAQISREQGSAELTITGAVQSDPTKAPCLEGSGDIERRTLSLVVQLGVHAGVAESDPVAAAEQVLRVFVFDLGVASLVSAEILGPISLGPKLPARQPLVATPPPPVTLFPRFTTSSSTLSRTSSVGSGATLQSRPSMSPKRFSGSFRSYGSADLEDSSSVISASSMASGGGYREPTPSAQALFTTEGMKRVSLKRASTIQQVLSGFGPGRPKLRDHFEVLELLGEGGFATVHCAVHKRSGKHTAVKTMLLPASGHQNDNGGAKHSVSAKTSNAPSSEEIHQKKVREFEFEIRVMERIRQELPLHPNIIRLYAVCTDVQPQRTCLVMEKMEGGELFDRIVERSHYTEQDACFLFRTLVRAVHALHKEARVIHRDLKPENILFQDKSHYATVKLCDFGTAYLIDHPADDPYAGKKIGSPGYTAPEVLQVGKYTPACDVFSLGVLLYILLVGYMPFPGEGFAQKMKIFSGDFSFPDEDWGNISQLAKDLISRMLEPANLERVSTTEILEHEWFERISAIGSTEKPSSDLGSTQQRIKGLSTRRKFKAAALAAVMSARMRLSRTIKDKAMESIGGGSGGGASTK